MQKSRSEVLLYLASLLDKNRNAILSSNRDDMTSAKGDDIALIDRLKVDEKKIDDMCASLVHTASKDDPDGKVLYEYTNAEGLNFKNISVPFGKILIIYESRPDVTIEAAAMAFKSGNQILLKGGKEARLTNLALVRLWHEALKYFGFEIDLIKYLDVGRMEIQEFISDNTNKIDLIIPRGGDALIKFVVDHAKAPVIVSGRGNNFLYIHHTADKEMAIKLALNGKNRISVCNATDKVLIDKNLPEVENFIRSLTSDLRNAGLDIYGNRSMIDFQEEMVLDINEKTMSEEFLSKKILLCLVENIDQAIDTINTYSGGHSAAIVSEDKKAASDFMQKTDCAAVYHNASTRFTDGGQVGFGGEMAISTQKLHFRGPLGMSQLVTNKWLVYGQGHTRK